MPQTVPDRPPMPADHRRRRTLMQWARILLRRPGDHRICWCAACDPFESNARRSFGMPVAHPEWLIRVLPDADEEYLQALAGEQWPNDEYAVIITEFRDDGENGDGGVSCTTT